ncbi:hypothetical protein NL676_031468 [Syzygium grande]|nr:hypothetical protein NL676_031468 [Syzygium grande]
MELGDIEEPSVLEILLLQHKQLVDEAQDVGYSNKAQYGQLADNGCNNENFQHPYRHLDHYLEKRQTYHDLEDHIPGLHDHQNTERP